MAQSPAEQTIDEWPSVVSCILWRIRASAARQRKAQSAGNTLLYCQGLQRRDGALPALPKGER